MSRFSTENLYTKEDIGCELGTIAGSPDLVSEVGDFYKPMPNGMYFKKKVKINSHNGYVYTGIRFGEYGGSDLGVNKPRRTHVLIAKAWIHNPRPDIYDVVGHMDNNKANNVISNLYWTNTSENTQKAVDDGLLVNDIGVEDSQSYQVAAYKNNGEIVGVYGSCYEADRCIKGMPRGGVCKVVDKVSKGLRGYYFKRISMEFYHTHGSLSNFKFEVTVYKKIQAKIQVTKPTGEVLLFPNQKQAAKNLNGIAQATISQCLNNHNGYHSATGYHFKRVFDEAA